MARELAGAHFLPSAAGLLADLTHICSHLGDSGGGAQLTPEPPAGAPAALQEGPSARAPGPMTPQTRSVLNTAHSGRWRSRGLLVSDNEPLLPLWASRTSQLKRECPRACGPLTCRNGVNQVSGCVHGSRGATEGSQGPWPRGVCPLADPTSDCRTPC